MTCAERDPWIRTVRLMLLVAVMGLAGAEPSLANDEVPHEARGHERSGYQLSNYENINLANGNLTFTIPLARVHTDGGLDYQLALHHNSKVWFTSRYCSLVPQGYEECEEGGGEFLHARIAHGVEEFGFGWDLRPPRVVLYRQVPFTRGIALLDATGARHRLSVTEPWTTETPEGGTGGPESSVGDRLFTRDGSNLRFTVTAVDWAGRPIAMEMDDGFGEVHVFGHVVPIACDAERAVNLGDEDLEDFNFRVERAGLYLSEIRRGPWRADGSGGEPANRISFSYRGNAAGWDSPCGGPGGEQWLPSRITAEGEVPREVQILYDPGTSAIAAVKVPSFDPTIGHHGSSGEWEEIRLTVGRESFEQRNGPDTLVFEAAHLEQVVYPNGATFQLDSMLSSGFSPLSDVVLPSGARVVYGRGWYPVGKGRCLDHVENGGPCSVWATCGAAIPQAGEANTAELKAEGVSWRDLEYLDAATGDGSPRVQTTWFTQGLNCAVSPAFTQPPNVLHPWPYDFDWALRDDQGVLRPEYLWTVVYTTSGTGGLQMDAVVEVHRFHPLTREEFSVDFLAGDRDALVALPLTALAGGTEDLRGPDVRVLRHLEIERDLKFGVDWPTLTEGDDRYSYIRERRIFTDEAGGDAAVADVESCYGPVFADLLGPSDVTIDCTEVRDTREVDSFLNQVARSVESERSAAGIEVARGWNFEFLTDGAESSWFLHRETASEVCEGQQCGRRTRQWLNLSEPDAPTFWAPGQEVRNPGAGGSCSGDCVQRNFRYDAVGNLETTTVRGGYGIGFGLLDLTTRTTHRHGVAVKKELQAPGASLVLWEREADPNTGLARWHLSGSGAGFAYLWDGTGRMTDLAPIEGDMVSGEWQLEIQQADDGSILLGSHIDYLQPTGFNPLRHLVHEATYGFEDDGEPRIERTWQDPNPVKTILFDGLGRVTRRQERYPGGSGTRSRLELDLFFDGSFPCGTGQGMTLDRTTRIRLLSEWQDDAQWSSCGDLNWTETSLDQLGRPALIVLPDGSDSELEFVGDSQTITLRSVAGTTGGDQQRVATLELTDGLGRVRVLEEELAPGERVAADYNYDLEDHLVEVRLWQEEPYASPEQRRTFDYSGAGFLVASSEPERSVIFTGYDSLGNLVESISGGVTTWLGYDLLGRRVSRWTAGAEAAWWVWGDDQPGTGAGVGEPSYGRVVRALRHNRFGAHDVPLKTTWVYGGPGGRMSSKALWIGGLGASGEEFVTGFGYDRWGHVAAVDHPVWSGWDESCQDTVTQRSDRLGDWLIGADLLAESSPSPVGSVERWFSPSGRVATIEFLAGGDSIGGIGEAPDPHGMARAASYLLWWNGIGALWSEGPYGYDGSGNVARIGDRNHAYDGLDRLVAVADGGVPVESYDYDRWGNLVEIRNDDTAHGGGFTLRLPGSVNHNRPSAMELVGAGSYPLGWDVRGNLTSIPASSLGRGKDFVYSPDDRLLQVTDTASGTIWRHAYDADGERVLSWRRDGGGDLAEVRFGLRDQSASVLSDWILVPGTTFGPTRDYLRIGGRLAVQLDHAGGALTPSFGAHDHLGSTRALVATDGTLTDLLEYRPYGGLRVGGPAPGTSHLFTGHERELGTTASELDFMHARHYSPLLGRFTSVDSVGGNPASSQSWNRYAYTAGNPLRSVDPDGRYERDVHENLSIYLAVKAGWSNVDARMIGASNQGVDDETPANPLDPRDFALHFGSRDKAIARARAAQGAKELGAALHSVQDSFSHEGYGWPFGHGHMNVVDRSPDDPWRDVAKALEMATMSFELLGGDPGEMDREFLEVLFTTRSRDERVEMLKDAVRTDRVGVPRPVGITPADTRHATMIREYYLKNGYYLKD